MTDDLISRQAALDALDELAVERLTGQDECQAYIDALLDVAEKIRDIPAAQHERKIGTWERTGRKNVFGGYEVKCSICGDNVMITDKDLEHYCRNCGARMEEDDEKGERYGYGIMHEHGSNVR